jgi:uncharacterized protein (UPF0332 family)
MNPDDRKIYIAYRLEKAEESLKAFKILLDNNLLSSAVNRLYYSCFYAVNALLVNEGVEAQTHSGIKNQFSLKFIKTNKIDIKFGKLYSDLFDWRQKGDYGDMFSFQKEVVLGKYKLVQDFIIEIKKILDLN